MSLANGRIDQDESAPRRDLPGIVYKTRDDAIVRERRMPAAVPPQTASGERIAWWKWTDQRIEHNNEILHEAIGQVLAQVRRELRAALKTEIDLVGRELDALRTEVGVRNLQSEVAAARADVPKMPSVVADLEAKQVAMRKEIARLTRELTAAQTRITNVHVELSQTRYDLSKLETKSPKPVVTVTLTTSDSSFVVRDDDPAAATAWQRFLENVVQSNPAAEGHVNGSATN